MARLLYDVYVLYDVCYDNDPFQAAFEGTPRQLIVYVYYVPL